MSLWKLGPSKILLKGLKRSTRQITTKHCNDAK